MIRYLTFIVWSNLLCPMLRGLLWPVPGVLGVAGRPGVWGVQGPAWSSSLSSSIITHSHYLRGRPGRSQTCPGWPLLLTSEWGAPPPGETGQTQYLGHRDQSCRVWSLQCTVYSVQCTGIRASVQCTVYSVQSTVPNVQCTHCWCRAGHTGPGTGSWPPLMSPRRRG